MIDVDGITWPQSLRGINGLAPEVKRRLYLSLVPRSIFEQFDVDPADTERLVINGPAHTRAVELILHPPAGTPQPTDPIIYLHMADTFNNQIAILLMTVSDPTAERYNVDMTVGGLPTRFGTVRRNVEEEARAKAAGLSPGQVRRGLRISREAIPTFERFVQRTGHDMVIIEPLTYTNAIVYERYGFAYFHGKQRMQWIDSVLRPGGELFHKLDGSTPFRQPEAWKSVRGRAWAIHDGVLGEPFGDLRMYKRVGHDAGINTFPDGEW